MKAPLKEYVNVYEFDDSALRKMNSLLFYEPTEEWVDFVHQNHRVKGFMHDYDIVYGPVANDGVLCCFCSFRRWRVGQTGTDSLIENLQISRSVSIPYTITLLTYSYLCGKL